MKNRFKITVLLAMAFGIMSCSSKPEIKELPKSANVKEEISNLEVAMENSKSEDLDLLAPVSYKEAQASLKKSKKMEDDDKDKKDVLKEVALGKAYLERARNNSEDSRGKLQDVLAARNVAKEAKANVLLPEEFAKLDKQVKKETTAFENDDDDKLKEKRATFITGYMDLELAAMKKKSISEKVSFLLMRPEITVLPI